MRVSRSLYTVNPQFIALIGSVPARPHSRGWGYYPSGLIGVVLLVLLGLLFSGRL
jgi:Protein of unknown function (DUF3309)